MDSFLYDELVSSLRGFFRTNLGYTEIPAQSRRSILSACEDPFTIAKYSITGVEWPLPQTGQMQLEEELLKKPDIKGACCITTSYRDEPNPIEGRHDIIFPMFEFEGKGNIATLISLEMELLKHLNIPFDRVQYSYTSMCAHYTTDELTPEHENQILKDFGYGVFIRDFPESTHPFWNMKREGGIATKVDVILNGIETIGSAERSCNVEQMRERFYSISDGKYAMKLFEEFGVERVEKELNEYLDLPMIPRFGGGIGLTRLAKAYSDCKTF